MARSQKLELAPAQTKALQLLETLTDSDVVVLQKIVLGKQALAIALDICRHTTEVWQHTCKAAELRDDADVTKLLNHP